MHMFFPVPTQQPPTSPSQSNPGRRQSSVHVAQEANDGSGILRRGGRDCDNLSSPGAPRESCIRPVFSASPLYTNFSVDGARGGTANNHAPTRQRIHRGGTGAASTEPSAAERIAFSKQHVFFSFFLLSLSQEAAAAKQAARVPARRKRGGLSGGALPGR